MKIQMQGVSISYHNQYSDWVEESLAVLQTIPEVDNYYAMDAFWNPEISLTSISQEGLVWDRLKAGKNVVKGTIKTGRSTYRELKKGVSKLKSEWARIRPMLLRMLRELGERLSRMWAQFMKYDKKYIELGKKIHELLRTRIHLLTEAPSNTFYLHDFNAYFLKAVIDTVADFDAFWKEVKTNKYFFNGNFPEPDTIKNLLQKQDRKGLEEALEQFKKGLEKLNEHGQFTILQYIDNRSWFTKYLARAPFGADREAYKDKKEGSITLSKYMSVVLLGKELERIYKPTDLKTFKEDMAGSKGFLTMMSTILNQSVVENAMSKGAKGLKQITDGIIKDMDSVIQQGIEETKKEEVKEEKEKPEVSKNDKTDGEDEPFSDQTGHSFHDQERQEELEEAKTSLAAMAEEYSNSYTALLQKVTQTYQGMVQGMLTTVFTLTKETWDVVSQIETQIGSQDPREKKGE